MLGDRAKYIEHINDKEQHISMRKIIDKAESVLKNHETTCTDFLDPYQRELAYSILNRFDLSYYAEGGLDDSERKSIVIFPEYMTKETIENPIRAIKIIGNFKFNNLCHRDYLGAIMGLGIKREKVGDIFIKENFTTVVIQTEILDFLRYNLKSIGKESVEIEEINIYKIEKAEEDFSDINLTISSLRADSLISAVCNISRSKSSALITQNKVKVNWRPINNISYEIKEGDVLSVRKFGRIKLIEHSGKSRKDKDKVVARIYK